MPNTSEKIKRLSAADVERFIAESKGNLSKKELEKLKKIEQDLDREVVDSKYAYIRKAEEEAHKKRIENAKNEGKVIKYEWEKAFGTLDATFSTFKNATKSLTSEIDKTLDTYIKSQQMLSAHLVGSSINSENILNSLQKTLSTTGLVQQGEVFNNLTTYVKSGIVYNVEQRAFLKTLMDDIGMTFDPYTGSLAQLIRIQNQDTTANRIAIEYSLQEFLNKNYQTSEYIVDAFANVSNSLLTAQSTMNASNAMQFEGTVQGWLGQLYSAGVSGGTINSLADAINRLGSGDITNLNSGISKLILMGASISGLDYGQILNEGLTAGTTDRLMQGIAQYMQEMGANSSNVVRSQLGNIFGVNISDLIASGNLRNINAELSTDIYSTLFNDYDSLVSVGGQLRNTMANMMWSFGTNIASNTTQLMGYEISNMIAKSGIGDILYDVGGVLSNNSGKGLLGLPARGAGSILQIAGIAASAAPLIPIIVSLFGSGGTISDIANSWRTGSGGISALYDALTGSGSAQGSTVKVSSSGLSGGIYMSTGDSSDLLSGLSSSLNDAISSTGVVVEGDEPTLDDNVVTITDSVVKILDILSEKLESLDDNVRQLSANSSISTTSTSGWNNVINFNI